MFLPFILDSWLSIILYALLLFIIYLGISQFIKIKKNDSKYVRSLVPLGGLAVVLGIMGYIRGYMQAFDAIAASGDISPAIVATAFGRSGSYPLLGLLCLAICFAFKYVNQQQ